MIVNVLQPLPMDEQELNPGMGYEGLTYSRLTSPYVALPASLPAYVTTLNMLLAARGQSTLQVADITPAPNQLKALVDPCHVYAVAVKFDVCTIMRAASEMTKTASIASTAVHWGTTTIASTAATKTVVREASRSPRETTISASSCSTTPPIYINEFHDDGLHYDEISILPSINLENGWEFCRNVTNQEHGLQNRCLQNAEFWPGSQSGIPSSLPADRSACVPRRS